jgi:hypothetical protein
MQAKEKTRVYEFGRVIRGVLRTVALVDITSTAFYCIYVSMHAQSTLNSLADVEYTIITLVARTLIFFMNVVVVKIPQLAPDVAGFVYIAIMLVWAYDLYALFVLCGQTYIVMTLVMRIIIVVLDVVFFVIYLYIVGVGAGGAGRALWRSYGEACEAGAYDVWDRVTAVGAERFGRQGRALHESAKDKDVWMMGLVSTLLPIETTAIAYLLLVLLSFKNPGKTCWLYMLNIASIVVAAIWYGAVTHVQASYSRFGGILTAVAYIDFFQLVLRPGHYQGLVAMRAIILSIELVYLCAMVYRGSSLSERTRAATLAHSFHFVVYGLAALELSSVFTYLFYGDAVQVQVVFYNVFFHAVLAAAAGVFQHALQAISADEGDRPAEHMRGATVLFFVVTAVVAAMDLFYVGTTPSHPYTDSQLAILSEFFIVSWSYLLLLLFNWPTLASAVHMHAYAVQTQEFRKMLSAASIGAGRTARRAFLVNRVLLVVALVDLSAVVYYIYVLLDQDTLLTGFHNRHYRTHWWDWFSILHLFTVLFAVANSLPILHVDMRFGVFLMLITAFLCLVIDIILICTTLHTTSTGLFLLRLMLIFTDAAYVLFGAVAAHDSREDVKLYKEDLTPTRTLGDILGPGSSEPPPPPADTRKKTAQGDKKE